MILGRLVSIAAVLAVVAFASLAAAQLSSWVSVVGGSKAEYVFGLCELGDGFVVAGWSNSSGFGGYDILVVGLDSEGIVRWSKSIGGEGDDVAFGVCEADDGIVVAGYTLSFGGSSDIFLVKVSRSGEFEWMKTIGGIGVESAWCVRRAPDGFVLSGAAGSANGSDALLLKLSLNGDIMVSDALRGPGDEVASCVALTADGGLAVTGYCVAANASGDIYVVRLSPENEIQWAKRIGGGGWDEALCIEQASDGGFIIAGWSSSFGLGGSDALVLKLDSDGKLEWARVIGGPDSDKAAWVTEAADGSFIVVGATDSFGKGGDIFVLKISSAGDLIWARAIGGEGREEGIKVLEKDGGYIVAGITNSYGAGSWDIIVLKLDADGYVEGFPTNAVFPPALNVSLQVASESFTAQPLDVAVKLRTPSYATQKLLIELYPQPERGKRDVWIVILLAVIVVQVIAVLALRLKKHELEEEEEEEKEFELEELEELGLEFFWQKDL